MNNKDNKMDILSIVKPYIPKSVTFSKMYNVEQFILNNMIFKINIAKRSEYIQQNLPYMSYNDSSHSQR